MLGLDNGFSAKQNSVEPKGLGYGWVFFLAFKHNHQVVYAKNKEDLERCVDFLREVFLKTCRGRILMQLDSNIHRLANN